MDIDLPLILMVALAITGFIWLLDIVFLRKRRAQTQKLPLLVEYSKSFFPVLAIVFVLRSFLIEPFKIPSESMVPTLVVGDFIAVNKFAYGLRLPVFKTKILDLGAPKRGDVVVFFPPHETRYFIKRLVGLPGDKIELVNNVLFVNGQKIPQEAQGADPITRDSMHCYQDYQLYKETLGVANHQIRVCPNAGNAWAGRVWQVPEGHYFMMGDNRDNSMDSRYWPDPFVPDKNIVGKAFAVWMHWNEGLPSFSRTGAIP